MEKRVGESDDICFTTRSCITGMQTTFAYASPIRKSMLLSCRLSCHGGGADCMHSSLQVFGSLFYLVVPLFDLASCSKYTVYQKSMQLAPPCARFRELQSCRTSMWSLLQEVTRMNITCTSYKWTMTVKDSISEFEIVLCQFQTMPSHTPQFAVYGIKWLNWVNLANFSVWYAR